MEVILTKNDATRRSLVEVYLSLRLRWFVVFTSLITFLVPVFCLISLLHILDSLDAVPDRFNGNPGTVAALPTLAESIKTLGLSVLIAPFFEAAIFHWKLMYGLARLLRSDAAAVIVSSVLFSLFHLRGSLMSCLMVAFPGLLWAFASMYWYRKTRQAKVGFTAACSIHILHNFYNFLIGFVPASVVF